MKEYPYQRVAAELKKQTADSEEKPEAVDKNRAASKGKHRDKTCPVKGCQRAAVCLPVTVRPFANAGTIVTRCEGDPEIARTDTCCGVKDGTCTLVIRQTIEVSIPVQFGADTTVGDTFVECLGATVDTENSHGKDCGCKKDS